MATEVLDDREKMVEQLVRLGFTSEVLDNANNAMLAEILRVYGSGGDGIADQGKSQDRKGGELPGFGGDQRKLSLARSQSLQRDDRKDLSPEEYEVNRAGFKAMGACTYAEARQLIVGQTSMRSGDEGHAGIDEHLPERIGYNLPAAGGYGLAWPSSQTNGNAMSLRAEAGALTAAEKKNPLVRFAEYFVERHRDDFARLGTSKADFVRTYARSTPEQRGQLIPAGQ